MSITFTNAADADRFVVQELTIPLPWYVRAWRWFTRNRGSVRVVGVDRERGIITVTTERS